MSNYDGIVILLLHCSGIPNYLPLEKSCCSHDFPAFNNFFGFLVSFQHKNGELLFCLKTMDDVTAQKYEIHE